MAATLKDELMKQLIWTVPTEEVAIYAAEGKALADMTSFTVKDAVMPDIVVGHAVVIIAYGSSQSIDNIKAAIKDIGEES